jgi:hypothetical protein
MPLWSKNVPHFGIAHALALGVRPPRVCGPRSRRAVVCVLGVGVASALSRGRNCRSCHVSRRVIGHAPRCCGSVWLSRSPAPAPLLSVRSLAAGAVACRGGTAPRRRRLHHRQVTRCPASCAVESRVNNACRSQRHALQCGHAPRWWIAGDRSAGMVQSLASNQHHTMSTRYRRRCCALPLVLPLAGCIFHGDTTIIVACAGCRAHGCLWPRRPLRRCSSVCSLQQR